MPALVLLALLTAAPKPSLSGVVNADKARALPPPAREALAKDGFTVVEGEEQHFFSLYDRNAYEKVPSFISLDVVLHVFHVRFDDELAKAETARAIPALKAMASGQLAKALARWPDGGPVNARQEALALYTPPRWRCSTRRPRWTRVWRRRCSRWRRRSGTRRTRR